MSSTSPLSKKITYITDQHLPVPKANSEQLVNTVAALANAGMNIEMVIPREWRTLKYSRTRLKNEILDYYHVRDGFELTKILHLPFAPFKIDKLTHGIVASLYATISKSDLIYTRNSLPALIGLHLGKRVLFEAYRIYDRHKNNAALRIARRTATSDAIGIISHSLPSKESLVAAGASEIKVKVIHNGFNPRPFETLPSKSAARESIGWHNQDKIVTFAGRIDVNKGANMLLDLAEKTPEVTYVLIGYSEDDTQDWVLLSASTRNVQNVKKLPWVPAAELPTYLLASDVLIIPPTSGPLMTHGNTVLPIKTFIYMAAGRCILVPALPDIQTVLNNRNAVLVEPDNLEAAAQAIRRIFSEPTWANALAAQAKVDSQNYTWESRASKIINFMSELWDDFAIN